MFLMVCLPLVILSCMELPENAKLHMMDHSENIEREKRVFDVLKVQNVGGKLLKIVRSVKSRYSDKSMQQKRFRKQLMKMMLHFNPK